MRIPYPSYNNSHCDQRTTTIGLPATGNRPTSVTSLVSVSISATLRTYTSYGLIHRHLRMLGRLNLNCLALNRRAPDLSNNRTRQLGLTDRVNGKRTSDIFIFSRPAVNLRPLSMRALLNIFRGLVKGNTAIIIVRRSLSIVHGTSCLISVKPNNNSTNKHVITTNAPRRMERGPRDVAKQCV